MSDFFGTLDLAGILDPAMVLYLLRTLRMISWMTGSSSRQLSGSSVTLVSSRTLCVFAIFIASLRRMAGSLRRKLSSDGVVGVRREGEAMLLDLDTSLGCGLDGFLVIDDWIESLVVLIMVKGSVKSGI